MTENKPAEDSVKCKDTFLKAIFDFSRRPEVKDLDKTVLIRGERSMFLNMDIFDFVHNDLFVSHFCKLTKASEENEKSRHQVDFIIFTKIAPCVKKEIETKDIKEEQKSFAGIKDIYDKVHEEQLKEIQDNSSLLFFIMSRDGTEIQKYDIIESVDKHGNVIDKVISPTPEITFAKNNIDEKTPKEKKALLILAGRPVLNVFDETIRSAFYKMNMVTEEELSNSFNQDEFLFKEKSDFIKERDLNQE